MDHIDNILESLATAKLQQIKQEKIDELERLITLLKTTSVNPDFIIAYNRYEQTDNIMASMRNLVENFRYIFKDNGITEAQRQAIGLFVLQAVYIGQLEDPLKIMATCNKIRDQVFEPQPPSDPSVRGHLKIIK